jgi:hypothetical protein
MAKSEPGASGLVDMRGFWRTVCIVAGLSVLSTGCGWNAESQEALGGKTSEVAGSDGLGGAGSSDGDHGAAGASSEPQTQIAACGLNGRGEQRQILINDAWINDGPCDDPDECQDGTVEEHASCADGEGIGRRLCKAGTWKTRMCACTHEGETYDSLAEACVVPVACDRHARPFGGGDGSVATPYLICSGPHLDNVRTQLKAHFLLARSLLLRDMEGFVPIGSPDHSGAFAGHFDGGGRALVGLVIDRGSDALGTAEDSVGLFRSLSMATIEDLKLRRFNVRGGSSVGTLVGEIVGDLVDIHRVVVDRGSVTAEGSNAGGLVGRVSGYSYSMQDSVASCSVTGSSAVGGLIGFAYRGWIRRSQAHGAVTALVDNAGGIGGFTTEHVITESRATGAVSASTRAGGLVGYSAGDDSIQESIATGDVRGDTKIGGLIGGMTGAFLDVSSCYALGNVTATGPYLGGLVGQLSWYFGGGVFSDSYSFGLVEWVGEGVPPATVGAAFGYLASTLASTVARSQLPALHFAGEIDAEGVGHDGAIDSAVLPASQFADQANFPGWDFDSVWIMSAELGRPTLRWEIAE